MAQLTTPLTIVPETQWISHPERWVTKVGVEVLKASLLFYPTSTVWGVGVTLNSPMIPILQKHKSRDGTKPLLLIWGDLGDLLQLLTRAPKAARRFVETYAFQPVTCVMPIQWLSQPDVIPPACVSSESKVGIRVDGFGPLLALIRAGNTRAWLSSSANEGGLEAPRVFSQTAPYFVRAPEPKILFEYGHRLPGVASTVVDIQDKKILRNGAVIPNLDF
jgi:tRNA A37 threonylcarbamoyladenosine synthetase subunit TsaC/SUA5/YrdC